MGSKVVGVLAALSVCGSVAWASTTGPPHHHKHAKGHGYGGGKVTICHRTGSRKHPRVTITVSRRALPAHLRHGDTIGPCRR
jgi:hypothetical protein